MKLLFCPHCKDVRKLRAFDADDNTCMCGKSWGWYTDNINAVYGGDAVMLGFSNSSLREAIDMNSLGGGTMRFLGGPIMGRNFEAFVIPESAPTVRREAE